MQQRRKNMTAGEGGWLRRFDPRRWRRGGWLISGGWLIGGGWLRGGLLAGACVLWVASSAHIAQAQEPPADSVAGEHATDQEGPGEGLHGDGPSVTVKGGNKDVATGVAIAAGGTVAVSGAAAILATAGTVATGACLSGVCAVGVTAAITGGVGAAIGSFFASPVVAAGLIVVGVGLLAWGGWKIYKAMTEPNACEVADDKTGNNAQRLEQTMDLFNGVAPVGVSDPRNAQTSPDRGGTDLDTFSPMP